MLRVVVGHEAVVGGVVRGVTADPCNTLLELRPQTRTVFAKLYGFFSQSTNYRTVKKRYKVQLRPRE